jgi:glyoxylate reductase
MRCIFVTRDRFPSSMYKKLEEVGRVEVYPYGEAPWSTRGVPKEVLKDAARRGGATPWLCSSATW